MEARELREEGMDAEPASQLEAGREQVQPLQLLDERGRVGSLEDVVAHLGSEAAEDGDVEQERAQPLLERHEDLVAQVVGDKPLVCAELVHGALRVVDAAQPQRGEEQGRRPSLRTLVQEPDLGISERDSRPVDDQPPGLFHREGKVLGAKLDEVPARAELRESQARIPAGQHDHPCTGGKACERVVERRDRALRGDGLEIVEHHDEFLAERRDSVHQLIDGSLELTGGPGAAGGGWRLRGPGERARRPWRCSARAGRGRCPGHRGSPRRAPSPGRHTIP